MDTTLELCSCEVPALHVPLLEQTKEQMTDLIRLNLAAGDAPIEGYDNTVDRKQGKEIFPLELPDNHADEIRCSHALEHFGHRVSEGVLREWVRVLKPGGLLKIAVPDLEYIATSYLSGAPGQYNGWLYGGQVDQNDIHGAAFDFDSLSAMMRRAGLVGLHKWVGEGDCSELEVSLNLAGYKRPEKWPETISVMSRPRLGFGDHSDDVLEALLPLGISRFCRTGAYWGKALTMAIDDAIQNGAEYILTMDYDSLFKQSDVEDLLVFMVNKPDADALIPVQMGRTDRILMNTKELGKSVMQNELDETYFPVKTGHFGLSLFRASAFANLPKPWFFPTFKEGGEWMYDDDVNFWLSFEKAGLKAFLTPRVVIGHIHWVSLWPDRHMKSLHQSMDKYRAEGKPRLVWR